MGMPSSARTGFERNARRCRTRRSIRGKQRVNSNRSGKPVGWPFARWLGSYSRNLHLRFLSFRDCGVNDRATAEICFSERYASSRRKIRLVTADATALIGDFGFDEFREENERL